MCVWLKSSDRKQRLNHVDFWHPCRCWNWCKTSSRL